MNKGLKLLLIYICGYAPIKWGHISQPFAVAEFFVYLVIHPLEFLAASVVFFIASILIGQFIRGIKNQMIKIWKKQKSLDHYLWFEVICICSVFILLLQIGWELTIVLFSLGGLYGMISVDKQES